MARFFSQWMKFNSSPPFAMLVFNETNASMGGLSQSYCALSKMQDSSVGDQHEPDEPERWEPFEAAVLH